MREEPMHRTPEPRGIDDPELARVSFQRLCRRTRRQEDSFGGYLRSIRRLRGLRVEQMAALANVPEGTWDHWEINTHLPSPEELAELVRRLEFSPYKQERLECLLEDSTRHVLTDLSRSRLSSLAAAGKAVVDPRLEWEAIGPVARDKLKAWARDKDLELPRDLLAFVATLKSDEDIEGWLSEVLGRAAL